MTTKSGQTKERKACKKHEHRIQQDESTDGQDGGIKKHHGRAQKACLCRHVEIVCGTISNGYHEGTPGGTKDAHGHKIYLCWIRHLGVKVKGAIVACHHTRQANQHFSKWWVHIKIECTF